jgi:hypothetical protein
MPDWTKEECERLLQLVNTGASVARASVALRRTMKIGPKSGEEIGQTVSNLPRR